MASMLRFGNDAQPRRHSRRQAPRRKTDGLLDESASLPKHEHGADDDDAVDEVRTGHQRRVQDDRDLGDDLVAGEAASMKM